MEKQQLVYVKQEGSTPQGLGNPAAYFVILKQGPGNGGSETSMLVAKQELGGGSCIADLRNKSESGTNVHPFECRSGNAIVTLENQEMWNQFYKRGTEMILTKHGRRMFPNCSFCICGLEVFRKYILVMDIAPVDNNRYKWNGRWWEVNGKAEPHVLGRVYIHPDSPSTGSYWMRQPISFCKLKLTNNTLDQEGHIILHSMHRYLPRLHVIPADKLTDIIQLNGPNVLTFTFPQTQFVAVTAYQNIKITQLKIDYNPFAKGFRDDGLNSKPMRDLRYKGSDSTDEGCSDDSSSPRSVPADSSENSKLKRSFSPSEYRKKQGSTQASLGLNFDGEIYNTDEEGDLEAEVSGSNEFSLGTGIAKKRRTTESILKSLPNVCLTKTSSEDQAAFNIVVKEEPLDDYQYYHTPHPEGFDGARLKCKEEDIDYDDYSDDDSSSSYSIPTLEKQTDWTPSEVNAAKNVTGDLDMPALGAKKRPPSSPPEAVKTKMLRTDAGKMPIVYLEPCAITKGTVKISELPKNLLTPCRRNWIPLLPRPPFQPESAGKSVSSPSSAEKSKEGNVMSSPEKDSMSGRTKKCRTSAAVQKLAISRDILSKKLAAKGDTLANVVKTNASSKAFSSGIWRPPTGEADCTEDSTPCSTRTVSPSVSEQQPKGRTRRRVRNRKLRLLAKSLCFTSKVAPSSASSEHSLEQTDSFPDVTPDLDDVEGVTFVSYSSQDALQSQPVNQMPEDLNNSTHQTAPQENDEETMARLELELIEELAQLDPPAIVHPVLEAAGFELSSLVPTLSLDLKRLGVVIPPSPATEVRCAFRGVTQSLSDEEIPFVSRTGKTNDFTKLKGWKQKLGQHSGVSTSKITEASFSLESSMKNRSAFLSDKLDEYLENEEKIIKQRAALCDGKMSPVAYRMPSKSASYVRTLDSVLKHRTSIVTRIGARSIRALAPKTSLGTSELKVVKRSGKVATSCPASKEHKSGSPGKLGTASSSPAKNSRLLSTFLRPPGLSKKQLKLLDLENSALWEGKPRTYVTEERAETALVTLLTAQGTLSSKNRRVITKRPPPCKNAFCRLGCICDSLSHVKEPPKHCRKPECMLSCKCQKHKAPLGKRKKNLNKSLRGDLIFYDALADDEEWKPRVRKKKRKKMDYASSEPEEPVRTFPLWIRQEGEVDPEPVYTTPNIESLHTSKCSSVSQPSSPFSLKDSGDSTEENTVVSTTSDSQNNSEAEDEKDPVYLYFESMMTCARVRVFERKQVERAMNCTCISKHSCGRENNTPSKVTDSGKDSPCKLKRPPDDTEGQSENLTERSPKSPCIAEVQTLQEVESTDLTQQADGSPQAGGSSQADDYPDCSSPGEIRETDYFPDSKNETKLIEIISDCDWEGERSKILGVIARQSTSLKSVEKVSIGNFILEIVSNTENDGASFTRHGPVFNSKVKISQLNDRGKDGKLSAHTVSVERISTSSKDQVKCPLTNSRVISPKEKQFSPSTNKSGGTGFSFYNYLRSKFKTKPGEVSSSSLGKSGMIEIEGNTSIQTKLMLGTMGALHTANQVAAIVAGKMRSSQLLEKSSLSASVSLVLDHPSPKQPLFASRRSTRRTSAATHVTLQLDEIKTPPDCYTRLEINKLEQRTGPCFTSLKPGACGQQIAGSVSKPTIFITTTSVGSAQSAALSTVKTAESYVTTTSDPRAPQSGRSTTLTSAPTTSSTKSTSSSKSPDTAASGTDSQHFSPATGVNRLPEEIAQLVTAAENEGKNASPMLFAVISVSASGVRTTPILTPVLSPNSTSLTNTVPSTSTTMSFLPPSNKTAGTRGKQENAPFIPAILSKSKKAAGPRMLLIPMQSGAAPVKPVQNLQLTSEQKIVLQPLRCPGGNLFKHPNGQIIQLMPLRIANPGNRPKLHQLFTAAIRNPVTGSVSAFRFPNPAKYARPPAPPVNNTQPLMVHQGIIPTRGRPRTVPTVASTVSTVGSPVLSVSAPPSNTITLKLATLPTFAPSRVTPVATTTTPQATFVTVNAGVQPLTTNQGVVQLQPGGFALLKLPSASQKILPTAIITSGSMKLVNPVPSAPLAETTDVVGLKIQQESVCQKSSSILGEKSIEVGLEEVCPTASERNKTKVKRALLVDHSYTSAKRLAQKKTGSQVAEVETRQKSQLVPIREEAGTAIEKDWLIDENMEVEVMSETEEYLQTATTNAASKSREESLKDSGEEDFMGLESEDGQEHLATLDFELDPELQNDMDDIEGQSDADDLYDSCSNDEAVDIETVEELSEKINIARLIASASRHRTKSKCHFHNPYLANHSKEEDSKPHEQKSSAHLSKEVKAQLDALVVYRTAHTVNERRRRFEMRNLFERLKRTLGLRKDLKTSKYYILKQAFGEIQHLQDDCDRLAAERSIQTRRRDLLTRKVALMTGKPEEVILKKLEYICAKQRALEVQNKSSHLQQDGGTTKPRRSSCKQEQGSPASTDSFQQVAVDLQSQKPPNVTVLPSEKKADTSTHKPLILSRKRLLPAPSSSISLAPGSLLMTAQGQVLTLKGSILPGHSVFSAERMLPAAPIIPTNVPVMGIPGIASVTIQLQSLQLPLQVNNIAVAPQVSLSSSSLPSNFLTPATADLTSIQSLESTRGKVSQPHSEEDDESFMMPRIVNVTSLACSEDPFLDLELGDEELSHSTEPLDFSMKWKKWPVSQGQSSSATGRAVTSESEDNSRRAKEFQERDSGPIIIVPLEPSEPMQTKETATSCKLNTGNSDSSKALDLSSLPGGDVESCARHKWTEEASSRKSASITEMLLGNKLELQTSFQGCRAVKSEEQGSGQVTELGSTSSQFGEPLLKANGATASEMVDTEGYETFTSLLNELAFLNQHFSDDEDNPETSSLSDHQALDFIDGTNPEDSIDELSLIHGPIRLIDVDSSDGGTDLKGGRGSGGSSSPLVLQLEGEDLSVEHLLDSGLAADSQRDLHHGVLDFEQAPTAVPADDDTPVNVSPPPLVQMRPASPSITEEPANTHPDLLWRPMPKLAPLGLIRVPGNAEPSCPSVAEHSPGSGKPMPALARISSPQRRSMESSGSD